MNAKNFNIYTIKAENIDAIKAAFFADNFTKHKLKPRHKTQESSTGFAPVLSLELDEKGALMHDIGGAIVFKVAQEKAVIKTSAIDLDAAKAIGKIPDIDRAGQYEVKNRIRAEHIAQAKTELFAWWGWFDYTAGLLFVGANGVTSDEIIAKLREGLDGLPVTLIKTQNDPGQVLTNICRDPQAGGEAVETPAGFYAMQIAMGEHVKLKGLESSEITLKGAGAEIIATAIDWGYCVANADIVVNGRVSLKIDDKLQIKNFKTIDGQVSPGEIEESDDELANQLANWQAGAFLTINEARILAKTLVSVMGAGGGVDLIKGESPPGANLNLTYK